jgi:pSer/pThr/pTyr-binding forkhead associated (FHA) protein
MHVVTKHLASVGRGLENDVRVTDISVSRDHAIIKWNKDGTLFITDLVSKFGSSV